MLCHNLTDFLAIQWYKNFGCKQKKYHIVHSELKLQQRHKMFCELFKKNEYVNTNKNL